MDTDHRISVQTRTLNVENCCRTCLSTENLMSLFGNFGEEKMTQNLKLVTGLEIKKNDGLPQKVCTKCLGIFNFTLRFRYTCQQSEKTLLDMMSVTPTKKYILEVEVLENTKIKVEKCEYDHVKEDELDVTKIKVETDSEYVDLEYKPTTTDNIMGINMLEYKDMPEESSSFNISFASDVHSEDDFEWKEDVKPAEKRRRGKSKTQKEIIRRRIKVPSGPPYQCTICNQEFDTKPMYVKHYKLHVYVVCESCGKRFVSNHSLLMHKRAKHGMEKIYSCAHCDYSASTKEALTVHKRRHTGERPFICDHCGTTFHRRSNLVQHLPTHLPEKKFKCSLCPHQSKSKKRLQIHIWNVHRSKEYRYKCTLCYSMFESNKGVHRHLSRVHQLARGEHPPVEKIPIKNLKND